MIQQPDQPPLPPEEPAWYCLRSRPKSENLAATRLAVYPEVEVFCPRLRFRRNTRRGRVWYVEALFPGYFFARFNARENYRLAIHCPGVTGMVSFGDTFNPIPDPDIEALRGLMDPSGVRELPDALQEGNETEVVAGPFRGLQVVVTKILPARERVRILLEFLGGWREIEVHAAQLASPRPAARGLEK